MASSVASAGAARPAYVWRESGDVPGTSWFYDVRVHPTRADDRGDPQRWAAPAADYRVSVCVCSHLNNAAYRAEFTMDKLLDCLDDQGHGLTPHQLMYTLRAGLSGVTHGGGETFGSRAPAPGGVTVECPPLPPIVKSLVAMGELGEEDAVPEPAALVVKVLNTTAGMAYTLR